MFFNKKFYQTQTLNFIYFTDLSNAQRRLSQTLTNFKFECIGSQQTEDEMVIGTVSNKMS